MKVGMQIFVTARKAITIESSEHVTHEECMQELDDILHKIDIDAVKKDLRCLFGDDWYDSNI